MKGFLKCKKHRKTGVLCNSITNASVRTDQMTGNRGLKHLELPVLLQCQRKRRWNSAGCAVHNHTSGEDVASARAPCSQCAMKAGNGRTFEMPFKKPGTGRLVATEKGTTFALGELWGSLSKKLHAICLFLSQIRTGFLWKL